MVAQRQALSDAAEADRVLGETRDREQLAYAAHREQQSVVGHGARDSLRIGEPDPPGGDVNLVDRAWHRPDPGPGIRQRHRDAARVKYPGCHLGQQRQVEEVVSGADQDDLDLIGASSPQPSAAVNRTGKRARGVEAGEAAADDYDAFRAARTVGEYRKPPGSFGVRLPAVDADMAHDALPDGDGVAHEIPFVHGLWRFPGMSGGCVPVRGRGLCTGRPRCWRQPRGPVHWRRTRVSR